MPRQLLFSRVPVELSIVEFDLTAGEELFLTYTWERQTGPPIYRDGEGPPYMPVSGATSPHQKTRHPFGLRLGSWLIRGNTRKEEIRYASEILQKSRGNASPDVIEVLERTLEELRTIPSHDRVFKQKYKDYEIVGQQGCGDLTMNSWNVAFVNNKLAKKPPALIALPEEPLELRSYSSLVKWRAADPQSSHMTIQEVKFERWNQKTGANPMVWLWYDDKPLPRGDMIEFAVSSQQIIRDGKLVPLLTTCHQFSDLRHLIQMPNINPNKALYVGESLPRTYFGGHKEGDIWLGEKSFLEDIRGSGNEIRAALSGPVRLEFPAGADERNLRGALKQAGYEETQNPIVPLEVGCWRFIQGRPQAQLLEIYFKRNTYGWTMVGLSEDRKLLLCLACTGTPGGTGYTLEEAAHIFLKAGAWDALLVDEGADVFQLMINEDGQLVPTITSNRRRLRACFIMARRQLAG